MESNRSSPVDGFHISGVELLSPINIIIIIIIIVIFKCVYCEVYDIETNFSLETINLRDALNNTNYIFT
jgi:hypothetical protein